MATIDEITELETRLRDAEIGPDPEFFRAVLADTVVLNNRPGKARVVDAHKVREHPKFTKVEMSDLEIREHGKNAAVVTCKGTFEGTGWTGTLQFMRVWLKTGDQWQIIAGSVSPV
jgi:hypothetical protein